MTWMARFATPSRTAALGASVAGAKAAWGIDLGRFSIVILRGVDYDRRKAATKAMEPLIRPRADLADLLDNREDA